MDTLTAEIDRCKMSPQEALAKALVEGPSDESRQVACQSPSSAMWYALGVDKQGRDDTREAACAGQALYGVWYAQDVDKSPHPVTRACACKTPSDAFSYAMLEGPHEDTRKAVETDTYWRANYEKFVPHWNELG